MTKINGNFQFRMVTLLVAILSVVYISGCGGGGGGSGQPPSTVPISIQNPQWGQGQGTPTNWQMNNDANHVVKVKVQTLDSNNNATLYKSYSWTYNYSGLSDTWHYENIEVPQSGRFVVQVEIFFTECTWQQTTCNLPFRASTKEYFRQQTFTSRPPSISFPFFVSDMINQNCICQ